MVESPKVLVIGLDGAPWGPMNSWIGEDRLPNLARLAKNGVMTPLSSTLPLGTAAAWSSIVTGKNPANHGVFEFMTREKNGYDLVSVNSTHRYAEDLWELVSKTDKRVCVFNVPFTYPPRKVNGVLVSGLMTPNSVRDYTYPSTLQRFLERKRYKLYARKAFAPGKEEEFLEELHETLDIRIEVALELFLREEWDFFMAVFNETDIVQHAFWEYTDPNHPSFTREKEHAFSGAILEVYKKLDRMIGAMLDNFDSGGNIAIVSDHGAGPLHTWVSINHLLMKLGYLRLKKDLPTLIKRVAYTLGFCPIELYKVLAKFGLESIRQGVDRGYQERFLQKLFLSLSNVDWNRTFAYCTMGAGQVFLNVKGREPEGIVESGEHYFKVRSKLVEDLRLFRDERGRPVFDFVASRDQFYGDSVFIDQAPDIVVLPREGLGIFPEYSFGVRSVFSSPFCISGTHSLSGVLILWGSSFERNGVIENASLVDVTPTLLAAMRIPIPNDLDGKVLVNAFGRRLSPVYEEKLSFEKDEVKRIFSEDEEEQIKHRLRALGYL